MSPPRIALLKQSTHLQGGLEKQTKAIIHSLLVRGYEVDLLCQEPCTWPTTDKLKIHTLSKRKRLSFFNLLSYERAVASWLTDHRYSHILGLERHSHQTHYRAGSGVHRYFLDERKKSSSLLKRWSLELNPFHRLVLQLEKQTFGPKGARRIYTNSQLVARQIQSYYDTEESRLCVIHNGVRWQALQASFDASLDPSKSHLQKEKSLPIPDHERCLLFLGHGYERKGLRTVLMAMAHAESDFHLMVAGKERHLRTFQELAKQLKLDHRIHWLGAHHTPTTLYSNCEALILPTLYDPFANVTLEALAMGRTVFTSTHDGASEVLASYAGLVLDPRETLAWAKAITQLWKTPHHPTQRLAIRQSVQHLESSFQTKLLIDDLLRT